MQGCESICEKKSEIIWNAWKDICFSMHKKSENGALWREKKSEIRNLWNSAIWETTGSVKHLTSSSPPSPADRYPWGTKKPSSSSSSSSPSPSPSSSSPCTDQMKKHCYHHQWNQKVTISHYSQSKVLVNSRKSSIKPMDSFGTWRKWKFIYIFC